MQLSILLHKFHTRIIILDLVIHLYLLSLSQLSQNDASLLLLNHFLLNPQKNRLIHLIFVYSTVTKIHIDHLEIGNIHITFIIMIQSTQYSPKDNRVAHNESRPAINLHRQSIHATCTQVRKPQNDEEFVIEYSQYSSREQKRRLFLIENLSHEKFEHQLQFL